MSPTLFGLKILYVYITCCQSFHMSTTLYSFMHVRFSVCLALEVE